MNDSSSQQETGISVEGLSEAELDGFFLGAEHTAYSPEADPSSIEPVKPRDCPAIDHVFYVNGILTDISRHYGDMQALADSGATVVGIHCATGGLKEDLLGCVRDKLLWGENAPAATVRHLLEKAATEGSPLHLVGHSRGGVIISRALQEFQQTFSGAAGKALSHIKIETYGSGGTEFIDGPQYVHMENPYDPVPAYFGTGKIAQLLSPDANLGKDAVLRTVKAFNTDVEFKQLFQGFPWTEEPGPIDDLVHSPRIYFQHRIPFEEAYTNGRKE